MYYVKTTHPITGETIYCVPTGKKQQEEIEVLVITPKSNLGTVWIKRGEILEE